MSHSLQQPFLSFPFFLSFFPFPFFFFFVKAYVVMLGPCRLPLASLTYRQVKQAFDWVLRPSGPRHLHLLLPISDSDQ